MRFFLALCLIFFFIIPSTLFAFCTNEKVYQYRKLTVGSSRPRLHAHHPPRTVKWVGTGYLGCKVVFNGLEIWHPGERVSEEACDQYCSYSQRPRANCVYRPASGQDFMFSPAYLEYMAEIIFSTRARTGAVSRTEDTHQRGE